MRSTFAKMSVDLESIVISEIVYLGSLGLISLLDYSASFITGIAVNLL